MDWENPKSVETKIRRLTREIGEIDDAFYSLNEDADRALHAGMLERKRDDMVRSAVLQLHTSLEDLLNLQIIGRVLGVTPHERGRKLGTKKGQALRRMLYGPGSLGFDMKLNFAIAIGVMTVATRDKLMELNTIRNKCSHNWILKAPVRRGKRPKQKKPPLLLFRGHDLHKVDVLLDFMHEYGLIYSRLFAKYVEE